MLKVTNKDIQMTKQNSSPTVPPVQITIKEFMELIGYQIPESSEYGWKCFGQYARIMEIWNGDQNGYSISAVYDSLDNFMYQVSVCDYKNTTAYQWTHSEYRDAYMTECLTVLNEDVPYAWDDVKFTEIESKLEFFAVASNIIETEASVEQDNSVYITLENIPNEELFQLMMLAHERNITLNALIEEILHRVCELTESE
jgi:hypothetical protein